jgi:hypothetical protein
MVDSGKEIVAQAGWRDELKVGGGVVWVIIMTPISTGVS